MPTLAVSRGEGGLSLLLPLGQLSPPFPLLLDVLSMTISPSCHLPARDMGNHFSAQIFHLRPHCFHHSEEAIVKVTS